MEAIKIIGEVKNVTKRSGTGQNGAWESISLAIEEKEGQYPDGASVDFFINDKNKNVKDIKDGDIIACHFNLKCVEWNGKWFTNTRGWKAEVISSAKAQAPSPEQNVDETEEDDLPF